MPFYWNIEKTELGKERKEKKSDVTDLEIVLIGRILQNRKQGGYNYTFGKLVLTKKDLPYIEKWLRETEGVTEKEIKRMVEIARKMVGATFGRYPK